MAMFGQRYWNKEDSEGDRPGDFEKNAYAREALVPVWNMAKELLETMDNYKIRKNPRLWRLQKAVLLVEYKSNYVDKIMKEFFGDCP
jgi:hypothetical protein